MRFYLVCIWIFILVAFKCTQKKRLVAANKSYAEYFDTAYNGADIFNTYTQPSKAMVSFIQEYISGDTIKTITVSDSSGIAAYYENGKWEITDCQKAIEILLVSLQTQKEQFEMREKELQEKSPVIYSNQKNTF